MNAIVEHTPPSSVPNPRLSVRTAARFLRLPAVEQMHLLHDQKFPKQTPQKFKSPYYQYALTGIRSILYRGLDFGMAEAKARILKISQPPRRAHSIRVIEQFAQSEHSHRPLRPTTNHHFHAHIGKVELRLSPDICATEADEERFIYFNFKAEQYDPESARMTTEIAYWLLAQNGLKVEPRQIEFIDLFTGALYKTKRPRNKTLSLLIENAALIERLWPSIEP